jgi:hypothetical protein
LSPVTREEEPDEDTEQVMVDLCKVLGEETPESMTLRPRGNGVMVLVHWRFMLVLVSMLERHQQEDLHQLYDLSEEDKEQLQRLPEAFDSICHPDRTMKVWGVQSESLEEINS